jgi:hypothetical protein
MSENKILEKVEKVNFVRHLIFRPSEEGEEFLYSLAVDSLRSESSGSSPRSTDSKSDSASSARPLALSKVRFSKSNCSVYTSVSVCVGAKSGTNEQPQTIIVEITTSTNPATIPL